MGKNQHVTPLGDRWQVKGEGNKKATKLFDTQAEAIEYAKKNAKNQKSELVIHKSTGEIREKNTYGKDPYPPKG